MKTTGTTSGIQPTVFGHIHLKGSLIKDTYQGAHGKCLYSKHRCNTSITKLSTRAAQFRGLP